MEVPYMSGTDQQSKGEQLVEWIKEKGVFEPPEFDHAPGVCKECNEKVWIDMGLRPHGMAKSCEEHEPLCRFQEGSRHA